MHRWWCCGKTAALLDYRHAATTLAGSPGSFLISRCTHRAPTALWLMEGLELSLQSAWGGGRDSHVISIPYPMRLIGRNHANMCTPKRPKSHRLGLPFSPPGARAGVQPIERTKLSLDRGCGGRRHRASFIGTGAVISFPSTKIAWN